MSRTITITSASSGGDGTWTVTTWTDRLETTSSYPQSDSSWTYTDAAGHPHRYDRTSSSNPPREGFADGYPTLTFVIDEQHWCDGSEGYDDHDPHMHIDRSHYECTECREVIEPGTLPPFTPTYIAGARHMEVTFEQLTSHGDRKVTFQPHRDPSAIDQAIKDSDWSKAHRLLEEMRNEQDELGYLAWSERVGP